MKAYRKKSKLRMIKHMRFLKKEGHKNIRLRFDKENNCYFVTSTLKREIDL